ncbi:MAG TPA: recombinase RecD [Desulfurivibrio alkaliphilus]|uniref:Recombinase RecD n=1 Tax=Desulfurivibrio alkaliphilus TaxID=427923 RepID=A0A7C2XPV0_9BACT|nr:recombinase RecD [Desulfurivibrio alkaliphilus]
MEDELKGIVQGITHHNPDNGWTVLRVQPFDQRLEPVKVVVHQARVFAGATMRFTGSWHEHPRFGRQFKAREALELKPATAAALEKYLGSGLIKGVGPKTARKIVRHFGDQTLTVFEQEIERLTEVPGIAQGKLQKIRAAWQEHRAIREVMLFLQNQGISTLFAVRIYKEYGDRAIEVVSRDPYRLAEDIYGIGFFSADRVALGMGFAADGDPRLMAAIRHILAAGREQGHCYLTREQVEQEVKQLLELDLGDRVAGLLARMANEGRLMVRHLAAEATSPARPCYYSKTLYYDEQAVADRIRSRLGAAPLDRQQVTAWLDRYCRGQKLTLSPEQQAAVAGIAGRRCAILTGGPGCGKTTTTRVLVRLLEAMGRRVLLAAPTGRAAQRLSEVVEREARTIHRLLEWAGSGFKRRADNPLNCDFLIVDESSMLDISLAAALLQAVPPEGQLLLIGDPDQLPPVGAGNVLRDLIASDRVPCFKLSKVFRQAATSAIIRFAHQINRGEIPRITSPFHRPASWREDNDCLFIDSDEASQEQLRFLHRVRGHFREKSAPVPLAGDPYEFRLGEKVSPYESELTVPAKFSHVNLEQLLAAETKAEELQALLSRVHPWSSLHYGLTAVEVVVKLYREWIPKYHGGQTEIQILTPMTRGTLGTRNLNQVIQARINPAGAGRPEIAAGSRLLRLGDRVIHTRNNYDLEVFNGDIGTISAIDHEEQTCQVTFPPDDRRVTYRRDQMTELELAYAITIHKSQGSEFAAVIMPLLTQHYKMLFRNLVYTGLTRAKKLAVLVGSRRALALAVNNQDTSRRQTALAQLLRGDAAPGAIQHGQGQSGGPP